MARSANTNLKTDCMKQMIIAGFALLLTSASFPQGRKEGPPKPPPPEKRWENDREKIGREVSLTAGELAKMKAAFMVFYSEMDALHENSKGQRPAKEAVDKIAAKRNASIKKFLGKDKYDRFLKVEKDLGPPKPKERPGQE
jgi:hypothetical protein